MTLKLPTRRRLTFPCGDQQILVKLEEDNFREEIVFVLFFLLLFLGELDPLWKDSTDGFSKLSVTPNSDVVFS